MSQGECGFSIIIPTYARPVQIVGCLKSLTKLVSPRSGFEVIIVDDGSPEPLDTIVEPFRAAMEIKLLRQENSGPAMARNAGAANARGRILAFTDDDCRPEPEWLCAIERALEANPNCMVGGVTKNLLPNELFASTCHVIHLMVYSFFNHNHEDALLLASNNMALAAELFHRLGGFDAEHFRKSAAEDRDLCFRFRELGYSLKLVPDAIIGHAHSMTLYKFCRQHFWYGQGAFHYHRKQSRVVAKSLKNDTRLHTQFYRWLPGALGGIPFLMRIPVLPMLVVWQLANAAGFFYESYFGRKIYEARRSTS
ncbi:MAG: glycosyltransferase [Schlesneria sp.]